MEQRGTGGEEERFGLALGSRAFGHGHLVLASALKQGPKVAEGEGVKGKVYP